MSLRYLAIAIALMIVEPLGALAQTGGITEALPVEIHGFVSQGFILSTSNDYLAESSNGSFEFAEVGINFTKQLTDQLRWGMQLFARDLGPINNYTARLDWFYLDYRYKDWLGVRAGRVKLPFGLYNEIQDIDSARVPVLLPQSVYPTQNRDFLLALTGGEVYGYIDLQNAGALEYRIYGGTIFLTTTNQPGSPVQTSEVGVPYMLGGRLLWETPVPGLRAGGSIQALELEADAYLTAAMMRAHVKLPAVLWVGSVEYAKDELLLAAEYSRWHLDLDSDNPAVFPGTPLITSERGYVMGSYRVNTWFQPGVYYSVLFPNVTDREGRASMQHDIAATARFDINDFWLVKLEGHYMMGTAGLSSSLNGNVPLGALDRHWGVFFVKTSAYF
jgi:hypothetical protein